MRAIELSGERFGKYLVIGPRDGHHWFCRCDCGITKWVDGRDLRRRDGATAACRSCASKQANSRPRPGVRTVWCSECRKSETISKMRDCPECTRIYRKKASRRHYERKREEYLSRRRRQWLKLLATPSHLRRDLEQKKEKYYLENYPPELQKSIRQLNELYRERKRTARGRSLTFL